MIKRIIDWFMKILGLVGSQKKVKGSAPIFGPANVVIPGSLSIGVPVTPTYNYQNFLGYEEANKPPSIDDCYISGTLTEGETITFNVTNHKIYNGGSFAPTRFRLLAATDMQQGGEVEVYNGQSSTFVLTAAEAAKRLRLEAEPRQSGGVNTIGEVKRSAYTAPVVGVTFNPAIDINWNGAYMRNTLSTFPGTSQWPNSKGGYAAAIQDGVRPIPSYNSTEQALEFTRSASNILSFSKNVGLTAPFEVYIRFKLKTLTGTQYLVGFNNTVYVAITSGGAINIAGGVSAVGLISAGTWYVLRVKYNGASTTYELNLDGTETGVTANSATVGSGTSRLGASWGNSSWLDGYLSEVFINDTELTALEKSKLKTWFGL